MVKIIDEVKETITNPVMPAEGARLVTIEKVQESLSIHGWKTVILTLNYKGYRWTQTLANCDNDYICSRERELLKSMCINGNIKENTKLVCDIIHKYSSKHDLEWPLINKVDTVL